MGEMWGIKALEVSVQILSQSLFSSHSTKIIEYPRRSGFVLTVGDHEQHVRSELTSESRCWWVPTWLPLFCLLQSCTDLHRPHAANWDLCRPPCHTCLRLGCTGAPFAPLPARQSSVSSPRFHYVETSQKVVTARVLPVAPKGRVIAGPTSCLKEFIDRNSSWLLLRTPVTAYPVALPKVSVRTNNKHS